MFKLFRKIRFNLMETHKTAKYLKYAIGEIILVVFGILIALQINNWNQELGNKQDEHLIIKNLNLEFRKNKISIQKYIKHHETILSDTRVLIDLVGEPEDVLNRFNLDSLLAQTIDYRSYKPSQSVVLDVISSGKFNLISSDSLRLQFFEWSSNLEKNEENYNTLDQISQTIVLTYLTKHASLKNIDSYGILEWNKKSKLKHSNYKMFQDIEFENVMDNQAWDLKNYILSLEELEKTMDRIIAETNREL